MDRGRDVARPGASGGDIWRERKREGALCTLPEKGVTLFLSHGHRRPRLYRRAILPQQD